MKIPGFPIKTKIPLPALSKLRIKFSPHYIVWSILALVIASELLSLYSHLYKNFVLSKADENSTANAVVRVNNANYNKVIERLDRVQDFYATSSINFAGKDSQTGRDNPFANPE